MANDQWLLCEFHKNKFKVHWRVNALMHLLSILIPTYICPKCQSLVTYIEIMWKSSVEKGFLVNEVVKSVPVVISSRLLMGW